MAFNSRAENKDPGITQRNGCHGLRILNIGGLIIIFSQLSPAFPSTKCSSEQIKGRDYILLLLYRIL